MHIYTAEVYSCATTCVCVCVYILYSTETYRLLYMNIVNHDWWYDSVGPAGDGVSTTTKQPTR